MTTSSQPAIPVSDASLPSAGRAFTADERRVRWFADRVVERVPTTRPARVLDVGCGDGSLLLHLADRLPAATFVGVDLSAASITAAARAIGEHALGSRIQLVQEDFMRVDLGRFDAVVAYSCLQVIPGAADDIAGALARALAPGGQLIHATPYACAYNLALNGIRAALRPVRTRALDAVILGVSRTLHPGEPDARLEQALEYMYFPVRLDSEAVHAALAARGLRVIATAPVPHASLGQAKHRLVVVAAP